ncbi:MAG: ABC transporter permease [Gammaproteobacteria bacterium]|nr:ABC transporter permease [Gammaproteobacteria bacterium]
MAVLGLAWKSLVNRRATAALTLFSIALSVTLLVGVERLRHEARTSFANTISGTDLIVGARSGGVQLLLYSVFRIGNPTNNISWASYRELANHPRVAWTVPISLGDSHRGYRVMGTTAAYFEHYRYARDRALAFATGGVFDDLYDAVLGAQVARKLGYALGDELVVAHGAADVAFTRHEDRPFRVAGILKATGTPVDHTVHVSLRAIEAIHVGWQSGTPMPGFQVPAERLRTMDLTPDEITAVLVGLTSRMAAFQVQRFVNDYPDEPLTAILPGVALSELWNLMAVAENALLVVAAFVVVVGLAGMLTALLASLNERRREMAILRSVGARPIHVFTLIMGEAGVLTGGGIALGLGLLYGLLLAARTVMEDRLGIHIAVAAPAGNELILLGAVAVAGFSVGAIPAYRAYRLSLADGLSIRV